jgi:hypothetical protein
LPQRTQPSLALSHYPNQRPKLTTFQPQLLNKMHKEWQKTCNSSKSCSFLPAYALAIPSAQPNSFHTTLQEGQLAKDTPRHSERDKIAFGHSTPQASAVAPTAKGQISILQTWAPLHQNNFNAA